MTYQENYMVGKEVHENIAFLLRAEEKTRKYGGSSEIDSSDLLQVEQPNNYESAITYKHFF